MTEHITPTGRLPTFPEFIGLFVSGDLKPYQKELLQRLVDADFSKLEKRITAHGCGRWFMGLAAGDEQRKELSVATVMAHSKRSDMFIVFDELASERLETVIHDLHNLGTDPGPPIDLFIGVDFADNTKPIPDHMPPVEAEREPDQRPFAKKTQHTKKPLPYYHGNKRRF